VRNASSKEEIPNMHRISIQRYEGKSPLGSPRYRGKENTNLLKA
jgi:hypothetical protein